MSKTRFGALLRLSPLAAMALAAVLCGPLIVLASSPATPGRPVLVISGWGDEAETRIERAGGRSLGPRSAALGLFAVSEDPRFADRLRQNGAWAVIGGERIAALCRTTP